MSLFPRSEGYTNVRLFLSQIAFLQFVRSWTMCSSRFHIFKSSFRVTCHDLRGLPLPHLPGTSNAVQRFIQSVLRFTWPNHRNLLARSATSRGGIHSLLHRLSELMRWTGLMPQIQRIMARSVRSNRDLSSFRRAQHSLPYKSTVRMHVLNTFPRVWYEIERFVRIGSNSRNLPHAVLALVIALRLQPPPASMVSPR